MELEKEKTMKLIKKKYLLLSLILALVGSTIVSSQIEQEKL